MDLTSPWTTLVVVLLSLLHLTCSETNDAIEVFKRARRVRRLIGGMQVEEGRWPWLVHLEGKVPRSMFWGIPYNYAHMFCGGTILNSRWILSAAHCFRMRGHPSRSEIPKYWHIRAGVTDNSPSIGDRIKSIFSFARSEWTIWNVHAEKIIVHPEYNENNAWKNDIVLIKLRKALPVTSHPHIKQAVLPPANVDDWPADEEECIMKGWGCLADGRGISEHAQMARLPKVNDATCKSRFGTLDLSTRLCAGYINGGVGICAGDSGGPLVCKRQGAWYLAGVASFTSANQPQNFPGVFTRVTEYINWITRTINLN